MKSKKIVAFVAFLTILGTNLTYGQSLSDILGGLFGGSNQSTGTSSSTTSGLGSTIGNLLEGVFSSSNITIQDMEGEWTATGPAVCFQSENFLQKAGGKAAAAAIETKLDPYYQQYGLTGAKIVISTDGTFTLTTSKLKLYGNITQEAGAEPGVFQFNFTVLGKKLAGVTTYVEKTSTSMDIMFDATKLKKLLSSIAKITNINLLKTFSSILDSYDGLCVGFNLKGGSTQQQQTGSGLDLLRGILNGSKKK